MKDKLVAFPTKISYFLSSQYCGQLQVHWGWDGRIHERQIGRLPNEEPIVPEKNPPSPSPAPTATNKRFLFFFSFPFSSLVSRAAYLLGFLFQGKSIHIGVHWLQDRVAVHCNFVGKKEISAQHIPQILFSTEGILNRVLWYWKEHIFLLHDCNMSWKFG